MSSFFELDADDRKWFFKFIETQGFASLLALTVLVGGILYGPRLAEAAIQVPVELGKISNSLGALNDGLKKNELIYELVKESNTLTRENNILLKDNNARLRGAR